MAKKKKYEEGPMKVDEMPTMLRGVSAKQLPEIKNWKVGGKYTIQLEVEQTEARKGDYMGEGDEMTADFKVKKIKSIGDTEKIEEMGEMVEYS